MISLICEKCGHETKLNMGDSALVTLWIINNKPLETRGLILVIAYMGELLNIAVV